MAANSQKNNLSKDIIAPPPCSETAINHFAQIEIDEDSNTPPEWIKVLPAGTVKTIDGREFNNSPQTIIDNFLINGLDLPVDVNHSSELNRDGGESPAFGWIKSLEIRDGEIWAKIDWNENGTEALAKKEYKYISPSILINSDKNAVKLTSIALVNQPAINTLPALCNATNQEQTILLGQLLDTLSIAHSSDSEILLAAQTLQNELFAAKNELLTLNQKFNDYKKEVFAKSVKDSLDLAIAQGKITPAQRSYHAEKINDEETLLGFNLFVAQSPSIFPSDEITINNTPEANLSQFELDLCKTLNINPNLFAKNK